MIQLTRLNHQALVLNSDLIKTIERAHDTVITLVNGEKLTVEEDPRAIVEQVLQYRAALAAAMRRTHVPEEWAAPPPLLPAAATHPGEDDHGH